MYYVYFALFWLFLIIPKVFQKTQMSYSSLSTKVLWQYEHCPYSSDTSLTLKKTQCTLIILHYNSNLLTISFAFGILIHFEVEFYSH